MWIFSGVELKQHWTVRLKDVVEAQCLWTRVQRPAKCNAVEQCAQRAIKATRAAVFDTRRAGARGA